MHKKILVTGGNGFIGREICRLAAERGHYVTSVSRGGRPERRQPWMRQVEWVMADIMEPRSWREHLEGCDAVIHCVGIVREHPKKGATYERINGDAAILTADEAEVAGVKRFVFLSANMTPPLVPRRYLKAKRRAERYLLKSSLHPSILRPTYVYGRRRPPVVALARLHEGAIHLPLLGRYLEALRPLPVEYVAAAAVQAATARNVDRICRTPDIQRLANAYNPVLSLNDQAGVVSLLAASTAAGALLAWALWKSRNDR